MLLRNLLAGPDRDLFDDRSWEPSVFQTTHAGEVITSERMLGVAAVHRAVNVLAGSVGVLPIAPMRRLERGKEPAPEHPLYWPLRLRPNLAQTSYRWRHHMMGHVFLSGNYYALKAPGPRSVVESLVPLDPERMEVVEQVSNGSLRYRYSKRDGRFVDLFSEDLLHVRGFSLDGLVGIPALQVMRQAVGISLAAEHARAAFLRNGARPAVALKAPKAFTKKETRERIADSWKRAYGGPDNAGKVAILEEGVEPVPFQMTSRDAQWVESANFQIEEFIRFSGVPGVLLGHPDKTATYASAEQFFQSFATYTLHPYVENIEQELMVSLLSPQEWASFLIEMDLNALLRADSKTRADFYRVMVELGILTRNEVRMLENRNPLPGLDEPLTPQNLAQGTGSAEGEEADAASRLRGILRAAAGRLVRKETTAILGGGRNGRNRGAATRFARDRAGWERWVRDFYAGHAEVLREALQLSEAAARAYCTAQRDELLRDGASSVESWPANRVDRLVELVERN